MVFSIVLRTINHVSNTIFEFSSVFQNDLYIDWLFYAEFFFPSIFISLKHFT